jgi:hypothetical protein
MGMLSIFMRCTLSMRGMRQARPPKITREPTSVPSASLCLRPEKMRISLGRQM